MISYNDNSVFTAGNLNYLMEAGIGGGLAVGGGGMGLPGASLDQTVTWIFGITNERGPSGDIFGKESSGERLVDELEKMEDDFKDQYGLFSLLEGKRDGKEALRIPASLLGRAMMLTGSRKEVPVN